MAYVPQSASAARPVDQSGSGSSFYALRAFFDANRPQGDAYAQGIVGPGIQAAQGAQQATQDAAQGGSASTARAQQATALGALGSSAGQMQTPGQVEGYLQNQTPGFYPSGQSAADAYLVGRAPALSEANRWQGVVSALNPMAPRSSYTTPPDVVPNLKKRKEAL